jgi:TPR repeat protein
MNRHADAAATVYVICNAAQIARDPSSQNILGIMYATGLGVRLNIDLALEWLRTSSGRRYNKATYHLAVIYGTGIVLKSYRLCDIPRNLEQADQYLREAAAQGNGDAIAPGANTATTPEALARDRGRTAASHVRQRKRI